MAAQTANIIGVFDSGIGGLSVLREIHHVLPAHPTLYVADQGHLPYGSRPQTEILAFSDAITRYLLEQGARVIVIACHTASAAALYTLRERYPHIPFVGMEPAVKPAAERTRSGVVGVLSTEATARGALYKRVLQRYARGVRVITQVAPDLVRIAEEQSQHTPAGRAVLERTLRPLIEGGADEIVLGCTHFPFLADAIQEIVGANVALVNPGPAVARQTARLWPVAEQPAAIPNRYVTSGDLPAFQRILTTLIGVHAQPAALKWQASNTAFTVEVG